MRPTRTAPDARALLESLRDSPASHRPMPLWVWNGVVTREFISRSLADLARLGFGGVFVHPRPGLVTEYLSIEWFDLFDFARGEAARLGIECHIYDENSFPAGFAGGHVPAANPLTQAATLVGRPQARRPFQHPGDTLALLQRHPDGAYFGVHDHEATPSAEVPVYSFELVRDPGDFWQGGFAYVDLTLPDTTRQFLRLTHDRYAEHAGSHFGHTTRYVFSDEPMLRGGRGFHFSRFLQAEFRREHGYDIETRLADLASETNAGRAVRFDLCLTQQRLFESSFAAPMAAWCESHGLQFTGHFMEHEWPSPQSHPSAMALQRHMHVPGNDLLGFQFYADRPPGDPHGNALYWLNLVELRSVAHQTGHRRTLCETAGGGGYAYTVRDIRSLEDFALAGGVTLVNPHLAHQTLAGARRYDWAQTISPHSPWFEAMATQTQHVARVQSAMLAGRDASRVLLLHPTSSGWLEWVPALFDPKQAAASLGRLRESQTSLVRLLSQHAIDFDLGDELMLRDDGAVEGTRLRLGVARYDLVVIPDGMANALASTAQLLAAFTAAGGTVLSLRDAFDFIDGRRVPISQGMISGEKPSSRDALLSRLKTLCPPHVSVVGGGPLPDTVHHRRRVLPDGSAVHFFANPYLTSATADLDIEATSATQIDTATGTSSALATQPTPDGRQLFALSLPPRGHLLLVTSVAPTGALQSAGPGRAVRTQLTPVPGGVRRSEPNLLVLDYCDVRSRGGASADSVPVIRAEQLVWRDHGLDRNPWRWAIQYRQTYLRLDFPEPSGFEVTYRFTVTDAAVLPSLQLAIERPHLYQVSLNGRTVDTTVGEPFFDEEMRRFDVGTLGKVGENLLVLRAERMHPLCEITPALLTGDFAVLRAGRGFTLAAARPLVAGEFVAQGLAFYNRGVVHTYDLTIESDAGVIEVTLPAWSGSVVAVGLDGKPVGWVLTSPGTLRVEGVFAAGTHTLTLDLRGHLKNQMGPWHDDGLPIPWAWEAAPTPQGRGTDYRLLAWGIDRSPEVTAFARA